VARLGGAREGWTHDDEMEAFSEKLKVPGGLLASGVVGVQSLRARTEILLRDLVMSNVSKMLQEVRAKRKETEDDLDKIGRTPAEKDTILRACVDSL